EQPERVMSGLPFVLTKNDSRRSRKESGRLRFRNLFSTGHDGECYSPPSLPRHRFQRGKQERKFLGGPQPIGQAARYENHQGIFASRILKCQTVNSSLSP